MRLAGIASAWIGGMLMIAVCGWSTPAPGQEAAWNVQPTSGDPSVRAGHAMAYDTSRARTVLFGGGFSSTAAMYYAETWEWDGTKWMQRVVDGPSARVGHSMAYDSARGVTVLFGGSNRNVFNGETWEWDGSTWVQRMVSGPSPRANGAMAYDSKRGVTVLFGGFIQTDHGPTYFGDTWEWDGTAWTQRIDGGLAARWGHAMAYDSAREVTVLFGGQTSDSSGGGTWEWNGTQWAHRAGFALNPDSQYGHAMAYDSSRGVTVLFGGNSGLSAKTWEWNGSVWTKLAISGPTSRAYHAMAYDSARKQTVLFGGERISPVLFYGDTQTYGAVSCPADLNGDRLVDDADFQAFVVAYNILDCADPAMPTGCPADLNGDNMVDDADFSQFVLAYDAMVCG